MFVNRREYELEKQWFEERIDQLEWLICKDEHKYVKVKAKKIANGNGEDVYRCKKCGKVKE